VRQYIRKIKSCQTLADDHLRIVIANSNQHFGVKFESLKHKPTSEQRPPVNNGHIWGPESGRGTQV
jgi:hypothetical protein